jgi:curved DNA-binding protein CbpA
MTREAFDYYEVLEVSNDSSQEAIYSAYKSAKETFSLTNSKIFDTFTESEAIEWINVIDEAYSVIGHPKTRKEYDSERFTTFSNNLPSFSLEKSNIKKIEQNETEIGQGFSKTVMGKYEVNPNIESLIEKQDVFDGLFLKKIREYKNIDLTEFSKHTCIAIRHLYAIENNNFSVLPASVFVRGYIIQYCRVLDLEQNRVVNSFMSLLNNG